MKDLDIFIKGETMNLCIPTEEFARESTWYSWFNNTVTTKFLEQGMFPNTPDNQVNFFCSQKSDRLILIISSNGNYIGTVSLSFINLIKKTCDVAIVVDTSKSKGIVPYVSLEAMARITEHAFVKLGMNRISAYQHTELAGWQQRMELLGYKLEGLHKGKFIKGHRIADSVSLTCNYHDFQNIINNRGGSLWDSKEKMISRCRKLPRQSFAKKINLFFETEREKYYEDIFSL